MNWCLQCGEKVQLAILCCPRCFMTYYTVESDNGVMTTLYRLGTPSELKIVPDGCLAVFSGEVL